MIIEDNIYFYHCFIMKNLFHLKFSALCLNKVDLKRALSCWITSNKADLKCRSWS